MIASALKRAVGLRFAEPGLYRFRWGEISWKAGLALKWWPGAWLHINLAPLNLFIHDPRAVPDETPWEGPQYGFSFNWEGYGTTLHLSWGERTKVLWMPWAWRRHSWEFQTKDGSWKPMPNMRRGEPWADWREDADCRAEQHRYRYCLRSFEVQDVTATIRVERTELRWAALRWLPFPRRRNAAIDVRFSGEVGERAGSWKGGCIGCGYTMRKDELPIECLRRMERERKFT